MNKIWDLLVLSVFLLSVGCAPSAWKLAGGPVECEKMCAKWGLEFTAIVGVGDQGNPYGSGATACICQPKGKCGASLQGGGGSSAGLSAPIVAEQEAAQIAASSAAAAQAANMINVRK